MRWGRVGPQMNQQLGGMPIPHNARRHLRVLGVDGPNFAVPRVVSTRKLLRRVLTFAQAGTRAAVQITAPLSQRGK